MRRRSPTTALECRTIRATLYAHGVTWKALTKMLGGRDQLARHLLAGRSAPRPLALAALPESVVLDYLRRLRRGRLREVVRRGEQS